MGHQRRRANVTVAQILLAAGASAAPATPDTWDPANKGSNVTLSNGDLTANVAFDGQWALSVDSKSSGLLYFEALIGTQSTLFGFIGIAGAAQDPNSGTQTPPNMLQRGSGNVSGGTSNNNGAAGWASGDVVGVAVDVAGKTVYFYKNNVANGSVILSTFAGAFRIAAHQSWGGGNYNFTLRTTTAEFSYSPPTGYTPWAE